MPHFDEDGGDTWICQVCGNIQNSLVASDWRTDITGIHAAGNVCPSCLQAHAHTGKTGNDLRIYVTAMKRRNDSGPLQHSNYYSNPLDYEKILYDH